MDKLYNINLFHQSFVINGIDCGIIAQFFINVETHYYVKILLLHSKEKSNNIYLMALDSQNIKIVPIPSKALNTVIHAMKQIPFPDEYQCAINALHEIEFKSINNAEMIRLSQNIFALIDSTSIISSALNIQLELNEGIRLIPRSFIFAAFDGINISTCFVLDNEYIIYNRSWGALSKICIYLDEDFLGEYYLLNNRVIDESQTAFTCQPKLNSILHRRKNSGIRTMGINIYEITDFLVSSAGLYNSVTIPEDYLNQRKWYTIVAPLIGLQLSEEFGLGGVEFYKKTNVEISRVLEFDNRFAEFEVFAFVHINDIKMHSALLAAKRQIDQAIDLLVNLLKDDSIFSLHSIGEILSERNVELFDKKVALSSLTYIESPQTNSRLSANTAESTAISNLLVTEQFLRQKAELEKIELLLIKANGTNDKDITPLFNSLKWIRKAWDTSDFDDKIISAVIALEFIISKECNVPLIDKQTRKKCEMAIREILDDNQAVGKVDCVEKVCETFNRSVTESAFMVKLNNLIERLNIPITSDEMKLISMSRLQRNEIVHGRNEVQLPDDDIYRLCECIGRIAFYKLNSLEA